MPNTNPLYPPASTPVGLDAQGIDSTCYFAVAIYFAAVPSGASAFVQITCPATLASLNLTAPAGTTTPIPIAVPMGGSAVGLAYTYTVQPDPSSATRVIVQFTVTNNGAASVSGYWLFEADNASTPSNYVVSVDGTFAFLAQIVGDPLFATPTFGSPIKDSAPNLLSGTVSVLAPTLSGGPFPAAGRPPLPVLGGAWQQNAPSTASADLTGQTTTVNAAANSITVATPSTCLAPVVKASTVFTFGLVATYTTGTSYSVSNEWDIAVTVNPRGRQMILVFDRTGSMSSPLTAAPGDPAKFTVASQAAYVWADIWAAFRGPVTGLVAPEKDKAGILVFDNQTASWGAFTSAADLMIGPPPATNAGVALSDTATFASGLSAAPNLGFPRSCTSIGDALIAAMDSFDTADATPDTEYVILLLTDGYENCGHVVLDPATSPAGTVNWTSAFVDEISAPPLGKPGRAQVAKQLVLYSVGFGSLVDMGALNALPSSVAAGVFSHSGPVGLYGQVSTSTALMSQLGMFTASALGANAIAPSPATGNPLTFTVNGHEQILVFALAWTSISPIEVKYSQDGGTTFVSVTAPLAGGVTVLSRSTHGLVVIDLVALAGSSTFDQTRAAIWRVQSSAAADISQQTLCLVDLFLNAQFALDRPTYQIGDPIKISCTLQAGGQPVSGATVKVVNELPLEGLGTFLAVNGAGYVPVPQPRPNKDRSGAGGDPLHPKPAMFSQLLAQKKLTGLPVSRAPAIFSDQSDQLHDDGTHTGVYSNVFVNTAKEGALTCTFLATGTLPNGDPFSRTFTVSTWVGVKIEPANSPVTLTFGASAPTGFLGAVVDVLPRSSNGEYLGPFRTGDISFAVAGGSLAGPIQTTPDGHYQQTIYYKEGDIPIVTVDGQGTPFPPTIITKNPLCKLWREIPLLWSEIVEEIECCVCGCKHPPHATGTGIWERFKGILQKRGV
jgi:hypothetical protein